MPKKEKLLEIFDYPVVYLLGITLGVIALMAILTYCFKSWGWTGPASLVQHP